jgi:hypothetical protein
MNSPPLDMSISTTKRNQDTNKHVFTELLAQYNISARRASEMIMAQAEKFGAGMLFGIINPRLAQYWANTEGDSRRSYAPPDWALHALEAALVQEGLLVKSKASKHNPFLRVRLVLNTRQRLHQILVDEELFIEFQSRRVDIKARQFGAIDLDTINLAITALRFYAET